MAAPLTRIYQRFRVWVCNSVSSPSTTLVAATLLFLPASWLTNFSFVNSLQLLGRRVPTSPRALSPADVYSQNTGALCVLLLSLSFSHSIQPIHFDTESCTFPLAWRCVAIPLFAMWPVTGCCGVSCCSGGFLLANCSVSWKSRDGDEVGGLLITLILPTMPVSKISGISKTWSELTSCTFVILPLKWTFNFSCVRLVSDCK